MGFSGEIADQAKEEEDRGSQQYTESMGDVATATCIAAASLVVYVATINPHVPGGDSPELIAAAYQLGVGHPPGYPLFCLVSKIASALLYPLGSVAWRANVATAVVGACASGVLYLVARRAGSCPISAVLASGLYTLNPIVWHYSTHAEVFALNNLLCSAIMYFTLVYFDDPSPATAQRGAFFIGLATTNQHTSVLLSIPLAAAVLVRSRGRLLRPSSLLSLVLCFIVGFSPYIYLPLATLRAPYVSWGDGVTLAGFYRQLLRVEYGSLRLSADDKEKGRLVENSEFWLRDFGENHPRGTWILTVVGLLTLGFGVGSAGRLWMAVALVFYVVVFHTLANLPLRGRADHLSTIRRFWMQPCLIEALFTSIGLTRILSWAPCFSFRDVAVGGAVAAALLVWGEMHWEAMDQTGNYIVGEFGTEVLDHLPRDALFLSMTDLVTNSVRYIQDVTVLDQNIISSEWFVSQQVHNVPGVSFPKALYWPSREDGFDMREFMDHNYGKHRVFTFAGAKDPSHENAGFRAIPYGYSEEIIRPMDRFNLSPWQVNESMWAESVEYHMPRSPPFVSTASVDKYRWGSWEYKAIEEYFMAIQRYGVHAYGLGKDYPLSAYPACVRIFSQGVEDMSKIGGLSGCNCSLREFSTLFRKHLGGCHYLALENGVGDSMSNLRGMAEHWGAYVEEKKEEMGGEAGLVEEDRQIAGLLRVRAREIVQAQVLVGVDKK